MLDGMTLNCGQRLEQSVNKTAMEIQLVMLRGRDNELVPETLTSLKGWPFERCTTPFYDWQNAN